MLSTQITKRQRLLIVMFKMMKYNKKIKICNAKGVRMKMQVNRQK